MSLNDPRLFPGGRGIGIGGGPVLNGVPVQDKMWRKQGISPGWRIVDINGVDTKEMTAVAWRSRSVQKAPQIYRLKTVGSWEPGWVVCELEGNHRKPMVESNLSKNVGSIFQCFFFRISIPQTGRNRSNVTIF